MTMPPPATFPNMPGAVPALPTAVPGAMPGAPPMPGNMTVPNVMAPGGMMPPRMPMAMHGQKKGKGPQPMDKWSHLPPNNTVYINNLNEKINREELIHGIREVFGQYGDILDIVCYTKIKRCKGQAWLVFDKVESATNAIRELQNFPFYNKPMRVSYAKTVSDATLKRDGKPVPKRERPEKKKKIRKKVEEVTKKKKKKKKKSKEDVDEDSDVKMNDATQTKRVSKPKPPKRKSAPPNKTLFLEGLPLDTTEEELTMLFKQYRGFVKVKLIHSKPGIGFAEFVDVFHSAPALEIFHQFNLRGHVMQVSYAAQ